MRHFLPPRPSRDMVEQAQHAGAVRSPRSSSAEVINLRLLPNLVTAVSVWQLETEPVQDTED